MEGSLYAVIRVPAKANEPKALIGLRLMMGGMEPREHRYADGSISAVYRTSVKIVDVFTPGGFSSMATLSSQTGEILGDLGTDYESHSGFTGSSQLMHILPAYEEKSTCQRVLSIPNRDQYELVLQ